MILYIKNRSFCFLEIIYTFNVDCFDSKRKLKTYKTVFIGFFLHAALSEIIIPNCNVARPKESIVLWGVKNRLNRNPGPAPVGGSGGWISSCCCCSLLISYACCWSKFWTSGCGIKNDVEDITGPRQILTLFKGWLATVASWDDTPRTRTTSSKLETGHWTLIPYY